MYGPAQHERMLLTLLPDVWLCVCLITWTGPSTPSSVICLMDGAPNQNRVSPSHRPDATRPPEVGGPARAHPCVYVHMDMRGSEPGQRCTGLALSQRRPMVQLDGTLGGNLGGGSMDSRSCTLCNRQGNGVTQEALLERGRGEEGCGVGIPKEACPPLHHFMSAHCNKFCGGGGGEGGRGGGGIP